MASVEERVIDIVAEQLGVDKDQITRDTSFVNDMRSMLAVLKEAYGGHVDIEFTAQFDHDGTYRVNLVQCRPFQVRASGRSQSVPELDRDRLILEAYGGVIGQSRTLTVGRLIYVVPSIYGGLPTRDRHAIARLIGKLTHLEASREGHATMLLGPGRWGSSIPALGVPIAFPEIDGAAVVCEIDTMHEGLVPDLSLGTHFFNELVEMDMLYIAFFGANAGNVLNDAFLNQSPNRLAELLPQASVWSHAVRVIEPEPDQSMVLSADLIGQKAVLYLDAER